MKSTIIYSKLGEANKSDWKVEKLENFTTHCFKWFNLLTVLPHKEIEIFRNFGHDSANMLMSIGCS